MCGGCGHKILIKSTIGEPFMYTDNGTFTSSILYKTHSILGLSATQGLFKIYLQSKKNRFSCPEKVSSVCRYWEGRIFSALTECVVRS